MASYYFGILARFGLSILNVIMDLCGNRDSFDDDANLQLT